MGVFSRHLPVDIQKRAKALIDRIQSANTLGDLKKLPSLRFKKLRGSREKQYSIRVNNQFRICFFWIEGDAINVELTDYH